MRRRMPLLPLLILVVGLAACGSEDKALKVTGIEPEKGDANGGTYVRIKGNRFLADGTRSAKVYFGSRQGSVIRTASDSEMIVEAPGGKANEVVDVLIIFEPGGELRIKKGFTFIEKNDVPLNPEDMGKKEGDKK